jgi:hypothetical protein
MKFLPAFFRSTASETISTISAASLISEILSSGIKPANNSNLHCYETGKNKFFYLCFIGSVGFDSHLTDLSVASVLFASASFGGGCSAGAYQQIEVSEIICFF